MILLRIKKKKKNSLLLIILLLIGYNDIIKDKKKRKMVYTFFTYHFLIDLSTFALALFLMKTAIDGHW